MLQQCMQRRAFQCAGLARVRVANLPRRGRSKTFCGASAKAAELMQEGFIKYKMGDAMAALKTFEDALAQPGLTRRQKQELYYGCTCVHARFGDVELAQITLRDAIDAGLDYEQALQDPDLIQPRTSVQISLQLKKFAAQMAAAAASKPAPVTTATQRPSYRASSGTAPKSLEELSSMLGTPDSDVAGVDVSPAGIVRRVALVLVVMVLGSAVLFFGGLALFPLDERLSIDDYSDMELLYPEGLPAGSSQSSADSTEAYSQDAPAVAE